MGALAGGLGGGGGASVSASSSASSGPLAGTTGSLVLNFGGINLGNQDIPLNAETTAASNAPPIIGNSPTAFGMAGGGGSSMTTYLLIGMAALLFWTLGLHKKL